MVEHRIKRIQHLGFQVAAQQLCESFWVFLLWSKGSPSYHVPHHGISKKSSFLLTRHQGEPAFHDVHEDTT